MQLLAAKNGGKCLSTAYRTTNTKLLWKCAQGHQWAAKPGHVKAGHWCPHCARVARDTIEHMRAIAKGHGGKCLSGRYINGKTKLSWKCAHGHIWKATPQKIRIGRWCPKCGIEKRTSVLRLGIDYMHELAKKHGGRCLSTEYFNTSTPIEWECTEGHRWTSSARAVKLGVWCRICSHTVPPTMDDMRSIAIERGGKFLSDVYLGTQTKHLWECADGHRWEAIPNSIQRGTWCPECSSGLGERICRAYFEQLFGKKFPAAYPKWLINGKGNQMELDGYCPSLGIAFEHQGEQHYSPIRYFDKPGWDLSQRQAVDDLKKRLCQENNVVLIQVPPIPARLPINKIKDFIKSACAGNSIKLTKDFDSRHVDMTKAYVNEKSKEQLGLLRQIAAERRGKCLSSVFIDSRTKLFWECANGHRWAAAPSDIKRGTWCRVCAGTVRATIGEMRKIAHERGGKCLSVDYINTHTTLSWQCAKGHQWLAKPSKIKTGQWCPHCARNVRLTIQDMQRMASKRGGRCLSSVYVNSQAKLEWECERGHRWKSVPNSIRRGRWCRVCAGTVRVTIGEMRKIALERGGKCLSVDYINTDTKLLWQCAKGHQWLAMPSNIKTGQWCPHCARNVRLTIQDMQRVASERGGMCLSRDYVNSLTKLEWECERGHRWKAIPKNIRKGSWCPICSRRRYVHVSNSLQKDVT